MPTARPLPGGFGKVEYKIYKMFVQRMGGQLWGKVGGGSGSAGMVEELWRW